MLAHCVLICASQFRRTEVAKFGAKASSCNEGDTYYQFTVALDDHMPMDITIGQLEVYFNFQMRQSFENERHIATEAGHAYFKKFVDKHEIIGFELDKLTKLETTITGRKIKK